MIEWRHDAPEDAEDNVYHPGYVWQECLARIHASFSKNSTFV